MTFMTSQSLSEWVRIAQLVTAGTGVPRVDVSNPGGGRAQPKFVWVGQDSSVGNSWDWYS